MSQDHTAASTTAKHMLTKAQIARFAAAFFAFNLMWAAGLQIVAAVLLPQRLMEIAPDNYNAINGVLSSATALASLVSNLIVGNLSDRTRTIFGKRTPWIFCGSIIAGVTLFLIGVLPNAVTVGISYCLCMVGLNMMIAPLVASLSDRVPEEQRGLMSAFYSAGATVGASLGAIIGAQFITTMIPGFVLAGVVMGISGVVCVFLWPHEKSNMNAPKPSGSLKDILASFRPPTKGAHDFWMAFIGRSLLIFSYYMILNYQLYILQDYIGQTAEDAAATISIMSTVLMVVSLVAAMIGGPLSDKLGRRKVPVVIASLLLALGYAMPWLIQSPMGMILFSAIGGFGYGMYGSVDQALNVDVLPSEEEAGKDLGILNIATTLGQMVGPVITSAIVVATAGYSIVFPVAIVAVIVACVFIMMIKDVK